MYVHCLLDTAFVNRLPYFFKKKKCSSARGLQDHLSKRGKLLWYGDSGRQVCLGTVPIDNGHRGKLQKRRIISLIGAILSVRTRL